MDLIDRQAAIDACLKGKTDGLPATNVACDCCAERIRVLPSAQPKIKCIAKITMTDEQVKEAFEKAKCEILAAQPEIIRCRDCVFGEQDEDRVWFCRNLGCQIGDIYGNGFCSDAERRTDE